MNIRNILITASLLALGCGTTAAQETGTPRPQEPQPERHYKPMPLSPEKQARNTTQRMDSLLGLTEKQYDKLYALHLKEARRKMESDKPAGGPPMEGQRRGGGPGGRPGFGGGNPPGGGHGMGPGGNGHRPPEGGFGQQPPRDFAPSSDAVKEMKKQRKKEEQQRKKMEKKIRKILTEEQYARWQEERMRPL